MKSARAQILEWAEQGALPPNNVEAALRLAGVLPGPASWRRFVSSLLLWLGAVLVAAGVIFFFAYNWDAMSRFAKFGIVEGLLVTAIAGAWFAGPDKTAGKAALVLAALLTGALLALVGQTYQTGADPYQLFAWWAVLILPWTVVSRLPALWLVLVGLLNVAVVLYFQAFRGLFGVGVSGASVAWALTGLNTAAVAVWELVARRGLAWMQDRWAARILATASGVSVTILGVWAIGESSEVGPLAFLAYAGWLIGAYAYYRHRVRDLFVLSGGVLSGIVFVAVFLGDQILRTAEAAGFLIIGLLVIGLSAAGAWWLKSIAAEEGE